MSRWVSERAIRRLCRYTGACCASCHDDSDAGYADMAFLDLGKGREAEVCCAVNLAFDGFRSARAEAQRGRGLRNQGAGVVCRHMTARRALFRRR